MQFRNGVRWESSCRDSLLFLLEEIVVGQCYTPRWFYRLGPHDVVVVVGANIEVFAAYMCTLSGGVRVACFEPDPRSYKTLAGNLMANQWTGACRLTRWLSGGSEVCCILQMLQIA